MTWIKTISYKDSDEHLKKIYDRVKSPEGHIDNILLAHSLRPHTLIGHMYLYKYLLHHQSNTLPKWFLESIGIYVSLLNGCEYCIKHHAEGLKKVLGEEKEFNHVFETLQSGHFAEYFNPKYSAALRYVKQLTLSPQSIDEKIFQNLLSVGFTDGEILEVNQVAAYFSYANRTVLGLGIDTKGEILGLSPSDEEEDWSHR